MKSTNLITLDVETLEEVGAPTYFVSVVDEERGSDTGVKALVAKPRTAFLLLKSIYNSKQLSAS